MNPSGKHFKKRTAILEYLRSTTAHPSAETVFTDLKQEIPDLRQDPVGEEILLALAVAKGERRQVVGDVTVSEEADGAGAFIGERVNGSRCCDPVLDLSGPVSGVGLIGRFRVEAAAGRGVGADHAVAGLSGAGGVDACSAVSSASFSCE